LVSAQRHPVRPIGLGDALVAQHNIAARRHLRRASGWWWRLSALLREWGRVHVETGRRGRCTGKTRLERILRAPKQTPPQSDPAKDGGQGALVGYLVRTLACSDPQQRSTRGDQGASAQRCGQARGTLVGREPFGQSGQPKECGGQPPTHHRRCWGCRR
jgi:hypothetical protein